MFFTQFTRDIFEKRGVNCVWLLMGFTNHGVIWCATHSTHYFLSPSPGELLCSSGQGISAYRALAIFCRWVGWIVLGWSATGWD